MLLRQTDHAVHVSHWTAVCLTCFFYCFLFCLPHAHEKRRLEMFFVSFSRVCPLWASRARIGCGGDGGGGGGGSLHGWGSARLRPSRMSVCYSLFNRREFVLLNNIVWPQLCVKMVRKQSWNASLTLVKQNRTFAFIYLS